MLVRLNDDAGGEGSPALSERPLVPPPLVTYLAPPRVQVTNDLFPRGD